MAFVKIKNKKGTGGNTLPAQYTSWLDFWEKKNGTTATICHAMGCIGAPDVGGHVIKAGQGPKAYILPICNAHNHKSVTEEYRTWEGDLVAVTQTQKAETEKVG